ncbi:pyrroline-5-carboxylate reductase 1 [Tropilaelaps mercedesae]|uniref:Pyrroline-5-carboxylate reductase n=1 Tax=Tropilaelaps mercedesae TaxID=418985 RepID=A0A1V9X7E6_9ACAR|nr:pyrroline-5-carboxylate reductase 1 [Tropilaelaps mercedesae]
MEITYNLMTMFSKSFRVTDSVKLVASCPEARLLKDLPAGCRGVHDNCESVSSSDLVFLAVKPGVVRDVLDEVRAGIVPGRHTVISIAAGVRLGSITKRLPPGTRVIRAMPNVASLALEGTTMYLSDDPSNEVDQLIRDTLGRISPLCERVASEQLLDATTAVAGSGPAFVLLVVEALADAAVRSGFTRDLALKLAVQTVVGAAALCRHTGQHPALLRDSVTSPGGTTAEGLFALEKAAVKGAFLDAVQKALERNNQLR